MTLLDLTRELVSIPSHDDEIAAGDYIEDWLRAETDATVTRDDVGNVIARRGDDGPGDDDRPTLALIGHHDVVPPDESQYLETSGEYIVEERGGRLYGRGAADMKGAVAAAMLAFRDAEVPSPSADGPNADTVDLGGESDVDDAGSVGELVFASFVGEETGGVGVRHAIGNGFVPEYAVVGEGSTNYSGPDVTDVVVAHKGRRGSTVVASGSAAHASEPEAGENAIYRASDAIDVVRELDPPVVEVAGETLEGSLVVTEIEGGSGWNVVPERCIVTVDERTVPGERAPLDRLESLPGVEWIVDQDLPPMECTDGPFAEAVLTAADETQAGSPELVTKSHATDAGWLARAGTECVICGPSEPGEAHTKDESVSIAVLERCYETYRRVAETWPAF